MAKLHSQGRETGKSGQRQGRMIGGRAANGICGYASGVPVMDVTVRHQGGKRRYREAAVEMPKGWVTSGNTLADGTVVHR